MVERMSSQQLDTVAKLERAIRDTWDSITQSDVLNLYSSWLARMDAVVKAEGGNTRFYPLIVFGRLPAIHGPYHLSFLLVVAAWPLFLRVLELIGHPGPQKYANRLLVALFACRAVTHGPHSIATSISLPQALPALCSKALSKDCLLAL